MERLGCQYCRWWDEEGQKFQYHFAWLTDWRPLDGLNPRLRQFHCSWCGVNTYKVLSTEQLEKLGDFKHA